MNKRVRRLELFHEFLRDIRARISFSAQGLEEIFRESGNGFAQSVVPYLKNGTLPGAYQSACEDFFAEQADKQLALSFLRDFGRSDLENQLIHLEAYCGLASCAAQEAKALMQSKTRVSLAFYSFLGAAAAILLV